MCWGPMVLAQAGSQDAQQGGDYCEQGEDESQHRFRVWY